MYVVVAVRWMGGGIVTAWLVEVLYGMMLSALSFLYLLKGNWRTYKI